MQYNILQKLKVKFYCVFKKQNTRYYHQILERWAEKLSVTRTTWITSSEKCAQMHKAIYFFSKVIVYYIEKNNDYLVGNI